MDLSKVTDLGSGSNEIQQLSRQNSKAFLEAPCGRQGGRCWGHKVNSDRQCPCPQGTPRPVQGAEKSTDEDRNHPSRRNQEAEVAMETQMLAPNLVGEAGGFVLL